MCGRFTLRTPASALTAWFAVPVPEDQRPRYNIAPSQMVAAVRQAAPGERRLAALRWGLIPFWADDPRIGYRMINARAESVASKPAFRQAFRQRRCVVMADGFYEWQKQEKRKQPFYVRMRDSVPFGLAGLWERWEGEGQPIESCTIVTTEANPLMAPIHDRMPVILPPEAYGAWLHPETPAPQLQALLRPYDADAMEAYPVTTAVNNPRNDTEACIQPVGG